MHANYRKPWGPIMGKMTHEACEIVSHTNKAVKKLLGY